MEQVHKFNDAQPLSSAPARHAKLFNILTTQDSDGSEDMVDIHSSQHFLTKHEITAVRQHALDSFSKRSHLAVAR